MIRGDGFNGIAVIIGAAGFPKRTNAKSKDGLALNVIFHSYGKIVFAGIGTAESANAKPCFTGPMTAGKCK